MRSQQFMPIVLLGLALGLSSCSVSRVSTDADPGANLNRYRTFKFIDGEDNTGPNPLYHSTLLDNSIHAEIAMQLEKRGILEELTKPDMLIAYHTYTEKKRSATNSYYPMMYGGWGWRFYPYGYAYPFGYWSGYSRIDDYTEGTLIIDAIDAKSNQLIWRGSISDAVNDPTDLHKKAIKAVDIIFKKFPVKQSESSIKWNNSKPIARRNSK